MNQVIVVGGGNWGKNLIRNFYQLNALSGIVEVDRDKQTQYQTDYPIVNIYSDYQEALKTDISAIVIATPAPTHYQLAKAALEAGKDVFVEKPMTLKAEQAKSLAEYADKHGRILMVGHHWSQIKEFRNLSRSNKNHVKLPSKEELSNCNCP